MTSADITLINPGSARTVYQGLSNDLTAIDPPIWARMIGGWLKDKGFKVQIIDQEAEGITVKEVGKRIEADLAAIVVHGHQPNASTQHMTGVTELLQSIAVRTVLVGDHVCALPETTLAEEPVDYVCDGEGPFTLQGLISKESPRWIPGLVYRENGKIRNNPLAPLVDIDSLHGDVWDMLPMDRYRAHTWQCYDGSPRQPYASIYTTLGCPFKCSFCMINVFQHSNKYRRRTPEKVVQQIENLYRDYNVRTFRIADEMFVLDPRHYIPICEGLSQLPFVEELNIWAYARVDTVKPDTLALMRKAGIRWLCLGIESGSAHVRNGSQKTLDDNDIREVVKNIQKAGISVLGNFIFGLPDDTMESMRATLDLAKSIECEYSNFYSAMAYPGSQLFDEARIEDLPITWSGYSQHSYDTTPLPTATVSARDVLRFRDDAFNEYFSDPAYLDRVGRKFGGNAVRDIEFMTSHKLERKLLNGSGG